MKLKESMYVWNLGLDVKVGRWPDDTGWSKGYTMSGGACYESVSRMTKNELRVCIFRDAMKLIIRDGVHPEQVHSKFMQIDEYKECLPLDMINE